MLLHTHANQHSCSSTHLRWGNGFCSLSTFFLPLSLYFVLTLRSCFVRSKPDVCTLIPTSSCSRSIIVFATAWCIQADLSTGYWLYVYRSCWRFQRSELAQTTEISWMTDKLLFILTLFFPLIHSTDLAVAQNRCVIAVIEVDLAVPSGPDLVTVSPARCPATQIATVTATQ